jgi:Prokaryotic homologs of the JAB domain
MLTISEGLVRETLQTLRRCGRDEAECVVLWISALDRPQTVEAALHPEHSSGPRGYEIAPAWMQRLWVELSDRRQSVCAQVHTHPDAAFHSHTDDEFPAVHVAGFVSVVVPRFARPPVRLGEIQASVLEAAGWRRSRFSREVVVA